MRHYVADMHETWKEQSPCSTLSPQGVMEMQVEVLQEQVPVCLAVRQLMWLTEIREILVARQDRDDVGSSVEVMLPFLQGVDNSQ
jgi:hypothetical protein